MAVTQQMIDDAITAASDLATGKVASYSIGGRSFNRYSLQELWTHIRNLQTQRAIERLASPGDGHTYARFPKR